MPRLIAGFLLGPLVLVLLIFCLSYLFANYDSSSHHISLAVAKITAIYAGVVAYAGVVLFGIPCYLYLKKTNRLTLKYFLFTACTAGAITGLIPTTYTYFNVLPEFRGQMIYALLSVSAICALSALTVALTIWYIGIRPSARA